MDSVTYVLDGTDCSVAAYEQSPDTYRGNIVCELCQEKAWFVRGFSTQKFVRAPCFAAHHDDECANKITLVIDEDASAASSEPAVIHVDLDKQRRTSIDVAVPSSVSPRESKWGTTRKHSDVAEYPENKSLRQILTSLSRNSEYPEDGTEIKMVADGGRVVIQGDLKDFLIYQGEISTAPLGEPRIFWGRINNVNKSNGVLWLNCGEYKTEPSIMVDEEDLEDDLLEDFRLKDIDDLQGADFIVVGVAFKAQNGKPYVKFGFTKYIAFRKYVISYGEL